MATVFHPSSFAERKMRTATVMEVVDQNTSFGCVARRTPNSDGDGHSLSPLLATNTFCIFIDSRLFQGNWKYLICQLKCGYTGLHELEIRYGAQMAHSEISWGRFR